MLFNRKLLKQNRSRTVSKKHIISKINSNKFSDNLPQNAHNFLIDYATNLISEHLDDIKQKFNHILCIACRDTRLYQYLISNKKIPKSNITITDIADKLLDDVKYQDFNRMIIDEENINFPDNSFDLIISSLSIHWINDVESHLKKVKSMLSSKGMFIALFFGGVTLHELREASLAAEIEYYQGASPRVIPFIDIKQAGQLMQNTGFFMPVADSDTIVIDYDCLFDLAFDLKQMGESNIMFNRRTDKLFTKKFFELIEDKYKNMFADEQTGKIPATFEFINILGFKD